MDDLGPAYVGLIRHELCLGPGTDALAELGSRLRPEDPAARPPYRAPGIVRLRRALRRLETGKAPVVTLEEFAADLQFLKLFEPEQPSIARDAMQRLLTDVMNTPPPGKASKKRSPTTSTKAGASTIVPFRRRAAKKVRDS